MTRRGVSRPGARRDRGAIFVEFALVVPLLAVLAMGLVEYGMAWYSTNNVNATARDAARSGTSDTTFGFADRAMMRQVAVGLRPNDGAVQRIVIYKALTTSSTVPANCLTASALTNRGVTDVCNVYSASDVNWVRGNLTSSANFTDAAPGTSCSGTWDTRWCPTKRNRSLANDNFDNVGVYIELKHKSFTGFGFGDQTIKRFAVFRLEPNYGGT